MLEELKRFIRWYIASSMGIIDEAIAMNSVLKCAYEFVSGFYIVAGIHIPSSDTEELDAVRIPFL